MIALFTDFGSRDAYVAQMKGALLCINPQAQLIDLNHEIGQFDIRAAAYVLEASVRYFPAETIFVAVVDPGVGSSRRPLLVRTLAEKWYIGPDNGLFTRVLQREGLQAAYALTQAAYFRHPQVSATFHGRDIFAPVAAHLSLGVAAAHFGPPLTALVMLPLTPPCAAGQTVSGEVVHIDHFGNVITNITADLLEALQQDRLVSLSLQGQTYTIPLVSTYAEGAPGQLIGLLNSDDAFELAVSQGQASACLTAQVGDRLVLAGGVEGSQPGVV